MAQNLKLDPKKRDYIVENGSPVPSDRVEEAVYYALQIPQGKWLYGTPDQGSLLFTLNNRKRSASIELDFAAFSRDAVNRQVVATGQAKNVDVVNLASTRTGTSNQIQVTASESQLSDQLNFEPV